PAAGPGRPPGVDNAAGHRPHSIVPAPIQARRPPTVRVEEGISSYGLSVAATSDQRHYGGRALFHRNMKKGDRAPRRQPPCSVPLWTVSEEKGSDPDYKRYASQTRPSDENTYADSTTEYRAEMNT